MSDQPTTPRLPLSGVRILSLEQYGAGPFGTSHLADLGAEVIKIEDPRTGGDVGRYVPPFFEQEDSLFFEGLNRGKKSISLDMSTSAGRALFEQLVTVSHAVYSNLRGDVPEKMKITYADLRHLNPAIVCCSLSGFGTTGPRRAEPGYDYLIQGLTGWMDLTGEPDGPPTKSGLSVVDWSTGFVAALALLAGLRAAERDGIGMDCDVSLYDTAVSMLSYPGVWHLNTGYTPARTHHSAHPSIIPFQAFEASDGWFVLAAPKEKFWQRVATAIGQPHLTEDPRFATMAARQQNSTALLAILEPTFAAEPVAHWVELFRAVGVPAGEVKSVADALKDPHIEARNLVVEAEHPRYGTVRSLASPVKVGDRTAPTVRAPQRGEHTEQVLAGLLAMDDTAIADARTRGAFGSIPAPLNS
ncbi:CaiB/BaiF CoA transferase family protein [Mycolicibacterium goodii]|uniref:CaiB/BaiF CoA transferase family protein n=1 Tax=Mycolicibacterium goodii TaxID=134601 RepID=UPI001BDCF172|nr:CoA transferase [Mycolicibacterium goodii]MBU8828913.1 CoA transferase [Mycolicibacterium goodii]